MPDPDSGDLALWDEIVVNNFKVKKVHVSAEFSPDFKTDSIWDDDPLTNSDFGWTVPFKLYDDDSDLVDYIDKNKELMKTFKDFEAFSKVHTDRRSIAWGEKR